MRRIAAIPVVLLVIALALGACLPQPQAPAGAPGSVLVPIDDPINGGGRGFTWFQTPAATPGRNLTLGFIPGRGDAERKSILVVPGSNGLSEGYLKFAREYAKAGFDVGVACYFAPSLPGVVHYDLVSCYNAPPVTGQSDAAARDLSALVDAMRLIPGQEGRTIGLVGHSRGGGAIAVRASHGHQEPIVVAAGLLTFPLPWPWDVATDVMPITRASAITAPTFVWHTADDWIVNVDQADWFSLAMALAGHEISYRRDPTGDHEFPFGPARQEFVAVTGAWLRARL